MFLVQGNDFHIQQVRQRLNAGFAAGGALVDGLAVGNGLRVGPAARVAALAALGLGQDVVDLVGNGVALGFKADGRVAEQCAEHGAQAHQGEEGRHHRRLAYEFYHRVYTRPAKPMKASDMSPAVTMPMAAPWKGSGTSATFRRSRMAANRTSTREKPTAAPKP